jgi:hypothetical protein
VTCAKRIADLALQERISTLQIYQLIGMPMQRLVSKRYHSKMIVA